MDRMAFSPAIRRWREVADRNPRGFVENKIRIADKMGREVPFKYNWVQREYSRIKQEILRTGQPLRLEVLKWRRCGLSAVETAESLAQAYGRNNARIGILAHQETRAAELLHNYKLYLQSLETYYPQLKLERSKDNIFGIRFEGSNSQVLIGTAENPVKIRGDGLHIVHGSESAHWLHNFERVMKEVCPVVPPLPGSQIILESTGTLRGSAPCDHYYDAVPYEDWLKGKRGKNEFVRKFFSWLDSPDELEDFTPGREELEFGALLEEIYNEEPRLSEKNDFYKLSPRQIKTSWRMYHWQSENDFDWFCREFPYIEDEAWSSGSASYFGNYELGMARPEEPREIYLFEKYDICKLFEDPEDVLRKVSEVEDYGNLPHLKIWERPVRGQKYVLGSDSASGEYEGDYSSGYIINQSTRVPAAAYHGLLRPDEAAHINVSLCRWYNNALAAPETNPAGGGAEAINMMQRLGYHRIYVFRIRDGIRGVEHSQKLGWWTHNRSRPLMLGEMRKLFLDCVKKRISIGNVFRDAALLREMRTFGTDTKTGTPRANANCSDDRVISFAIAQQVAADETIMTPDDLVKRYHNLPAKRPVIDPNDQSKLMSKKVTNPERVIQSLFGPRSGFMNNKFEL